MINSVSKPNTPVQGPLNGLIVLDLTRVLAGPFATMIFADMGATVIKVEAPETGDDARHIGPFIGDTSAYFASINRGKKSIALNLKDNTDRQTLLQLVEKADILVENFRGGVMEKLKLGYTTLKAINPRLIYAAISGFGQTGPYANKAAYDMIVQAMGGIMSITGQADSAPVRVGSSVGDITAGLFGASGILAALYHREKTGEGMQLDVGMLDCQVAILENAIARYFAQGEPPKPLGARHPSITPFEAFDTADRPIVIAAGNDDLFAKLCSALGAPHLITNAAFLSNELRTQHHLELAIELAPIFKSRPSKLWLDTLDKAGVPCGPINNVAQVVNDPHIKHRNMIISSLSSKGETLKMAGNPIKMSAFADPTRRNAAPTLDQDREQIINFLT